MFGELLALARNEVEHDLCSTFEVQVFPLETLQFASTEPGGNGHGIEGFQPILSRGLEESSDLSRLGAGAILRALLYRVINDYASVVDGLREDIAGLEDDVLKGSGRVTGRMTNRLYELSREVVRFQRVTEHLEAVLEALADPGLQEPESNLELAKRLGGARGGRAGVGRRRPARAATAGLAHHRPAPDAGGRAWFEQEGVIRAAQHHNSR